MKKFLSLTVGLIMITALSAQNFKADMQQMVEQLKKAKGIALSYHVTTYDQLENDRMTFEQKGYIYKYEDQSLSKVNDVLSLRTEELFLMVDDQLKFMQLVELNEEDENILEEMLKTNELKLTAAESKITYKGIVGGKKHYQFTETGQMREAHVYIDQQTKALSRLIYYYDAKQFPSANKIIIDYTIDFDYQPAPGTFEASKYVVRKNKKFIPIQKYSTYQLIVDNDEN